MAVKNELLLSGSGSGRGVQARLFLPISRCEPSVKQPPGVNDFIDKHTRYFAEYCLQDPKY